MRDLLDVEVAAMGAVVDGEHAAVHRGDAHDPDHRPDRQLQRVAPVDDAVLDLDDPVLDAELLLAHPVGEHADPRPERGEAEALELHVDEPQRQHVAGLGADDSIGPVARLTKGRVTSLG